MQRTTKEMSEIIDLTTLSDDESDNAQGNESDVSIDHAQDIKGDESDVARRNAGDNHCDEHLQCGDLVRVSDAYGVITEVSNVRCSMEYSVRIMVASGGAYMRKCPDQLYFVLDKDTPITKIAIEGAPAQIREVTRPMHQWTFETGCMNIRQDPLAVPRIWLRFVHLR